MRRPLLTFGAIAIVVGAFAAAEMLRPRHHGSVVQEEAPVGPQETARALPLHTASSAEEAPAPETGQCQPSLPVAPRDLAAKWPTLIGKRVSFVGRVEQSLEFGEALVVAGGARFAVLIAPPDVWTGNARRTYRVIGSSTVRVAGPTRLPQLLLESDDCGNE